MSTNMVQGEIGRSLAVKFDQNITAFTSHEIIVKQLDGTPVGTFAAGVLAGHTHWVEYVTVATTDVDASGRLQIQGRAYNGPTGAPTAQLFTRIGWIEVDPVL